MPARIIKRHDTAVLPRAKLLDEDGVPLVGLDSATVRYTLQAVATGVLKVTRATATVANQTTSPGEVSYQWLAGDVDTVGVYSEEWEVTYADGRKETFPTDAPQYVEIQADLDNT